MKAFTLDQSFVDTLHRRLTEVNKKFFPIGSGLKMNTVPSVDHLREIIGKIMWASTQLEEGKASKFRVSYCPPAGIDHLGLRFSPESSRQWKTAEIVKLAPAIVPPEGQMCVYPENGQLLIQGFTTIGLTSIVFEALDPARVVIRYPAKFVQAEVMGENAWFVDSSWSSDAYNLLSIPAGESGEHDIDKAMSFFRGDVTMEILTRVRLLGHGGTILFVSDNEIWKESIEQPVAFECSERFKGIGRIERALKSELTTAKKLGKKVVVTATELLADRRYSGTLADVSRTIAYLTGIDGALVLNNDFDVLAFGVKIKETQKEKGEKVLRIAPYEGEKAEELLLTDAFRGKRHLSTARFTLNTNSTAFTVSQDGGVTGFVTLDGDLRAYKNLELLF